MLLLEEWFESKPSPAGDLQRIEGSWEIRDTERAGVYLVVYESYVEVGGLVPTAWVRRGVMARTQSMATRLRDWIEGRPLEK